MTTPEINTITVHELKERREATPTLTIIDVREDHEWQVLRIPGAIHIPKDELTTRIEEACPQKNHPIYLHCRGGIRSLEAAKRLIEMGYTQVYSVEGGIAEWSMFGYPVEE